MALTLSRDEDAPSFTRAWRLACRLAHAIDPTFDKAPPPGWDDWATTSSSLYGATREGAAEGWELRYSGAAYGPAETGERESWTFTTRDLAEGAELSLELDVDGHTSTPRSKRDGRLTLRAEATPEQEAALRQIFNAG